MKDTSYLAKFCGWEANFVPVDPGLLGIVVYLYGGPIFTLIGSTQLMLTLLGTNSFRQKHSYKVSKLQESDRIVHYSSAIVGPPPPAAPTYVVNYLKPIYPQYDGMGTSVNDYRVVLKRLSRKARS
ncbi:hypothetical protein AC1031_015016 [Aphanomyces cochlioides]|nr:hypothetical protein AC1031_015016 [Aphanomyces cochlioides]